MECYQEYIKPFIEIFTLIFLGSTFYYQFKLYSKQSKEFNRIRKKDKERSFLDFFDRLTDTFEQVKIRNKDSFKEYKNYNHYINSQLQNVIQNGTYKFARHGIFPNELLDLSDNSKKTLISDSIIVSSYMYERFQVLNRIMESIDEYPVKKNKLKDIDFKRPYLRRIFYLMSTEELMYFYIVNLNKNIKGHKKIIEKYSLYEGILDGYGLQDDPLLSYEESAYKPLT